MNKNNKGDKKQKITKLSVKLPMLETNPVTTAFL